MNTRNANAQRSTSKVQRPTNGYENPPAPHFDVERWTLNVGRSSVILCLLVLLISTGTSHAADEGISVTGIATVKAKPTEVEIDGTISGEGELANDASVKYHDSKKKVTAGIEAMKNPDLTLKSDGSEVHEAVDPQQQQRIMQGMGGGETPKVRVQISEHMVLKLKNIDKLDPDKLLETVLKLIDTSRDAGLTIGPPPATNYYQMQIQAQNGGADALVAFKIPDITDIQNDAYKQAIADAKAKAQRLADLSGVKLGKVRSVQDEQPAAQRQVFNPYIGMMTGGEDHATDKEASSNSFGEIPVTVRLNVQFEIEK
jgi:uncharacterized protein YggE